VGRNEDIDLSNSGKIMLVKWRVSWYHGKQEVEDTFFKAKMRYTPKLSIS